MTRFAVVMSMLTAFATMALIANSATTVLDSNFNLEFPAEIRLIAVGGHDGHENIANVDAITLSSNSHTVAAPLPTNLSNFGSTMVNNTIYVVGGVSKDYQSSFSVSKDYRSSFLAYNVATNIWTSLPDFPFNITRNTLVAVANSIYSIGGWAQNYGYMNYTYKYDLNERVWSKLPLLPVTTVSACVVADQADNIYYLHSGDLYRSGGDLYRSGDGARTWTKLSSMKLNRNIPACALLPKTGQILVAGGVAGVTPDDKDETTNSAELYNIATDTWKTAESLSRARDLASAVAVPESDDVVLCGGENYYEDETYADCVLYITAKNQWNVLNITLSVQRYAYGLFATALGKLTHEVRRSRHSAPAVRLSTYGTDYFPHTIIDPSQNPHSCLGVARPLY